MNKTATFSPCRKYRYTLWRRWDSLFSSDYCQFICLNPSTADEKNDDPTVRRCIRYARDWGYSGLCMTNIFAFRATLPADMMAANDPVGDDNDGFLIEMAKHAGIVVAAWGVHGSYLNRDQKVLKMIPNLHCLKLTKNGAPAHPLYLSKMLRPMKYVKEPEEIK